MHKSISKLAEGIAEIDTYLDQQKQKDFQTWAELNVIRNSVEKVMLKLVPDEGALFPRQPSYEASAKSSDDF